MHQISRRAALQALIAGLAAGPLVAACGADDGDSAGTQPQAGGTLRVGTISSGAAVTSDPHGMIPGESDWLRMSALYDVLVAAGPDGAVLPALATDWTVENGATRHRFQLRTDAVFSDGRPVRAVDVLFSLRRTADKSMENGGRIGSIDLAESRAEGDHVVILETSTPEADMARTLAGQLYIVPDGTTTFDKPIGSGPFLLSALDGGAATLTRNERWRGPKAKVDTLEIRGFADGQALSTAVTSGEIDLAANVGYPTARSAEATGRLTVVRHPAAASYPLVMNMTHAPFDRIEVRRAVKLAVDRQALVDTVLLGYGTVANDAPFFNDASYPKDLPAPARDLDEVRRLLSQAGQGGGFDAVIHVTTAYPSMISAATLLVQQLAEVNIRATIEEHPPETYWSQIYTKVPLYMGYTTDALSIQHWARAVLLSNAPVNETGWRDAAFDAEFSAALATVDAEQRRLALDKLQRRLADEAGWVMWGIGEGVDVAAKHVRDLPTGSGFARYALTDVWLEK
ncbi:ABC transporter substrate-binding protein [Micromonospora sp. WMMD1082]|uniref:ABC transporter substrate-binding protein n=1 Tax=Micromonospora sp. WMMD1082 TaxID=3016104 RepID=UPI002416E100|nr:ABC transporter substrate-binding protein [Micromonospora sp. WMMD1082]MDG4795591.1 ABC transporter substrate-binding protein [Micromonospora sp. WMMD1082]